MRRIVSGLIIILAFTNCSTKLSEEQNRQLQNAYSDRNYFELDFLMSGIRFDNNNPDLILYKAVIDNAFNKPDESNVIINLLFERYPGYFNDTIIKDLYSRQFSNYFLLQDYKKAFASDSIIIAKYTAVCDSSELEMRNDDMALFRCISDAPVMQISVPPDSKIPLKRDLAGLLNVPVNLKGDTIDFVFDTGANISVIIESAARQYGVRLLDGKVRTGTSTSMKVEGQMGMLDLNIGNIEIKNSAFLVLPDSDLTYANGAYVIRGIIGFPIMYALKELVFSDDKFLEIKNVPENPAERNLAFDGQNIIIKVVLQNDTLPFLFDSGNQTTNLGARYFNKYQPEITARCKKENVLTGGAGGYENAEAYILDSAKFMVGKSGITLKSVRIYTNDLYGFDRKYLYGNFGQDYINKFAEMKINFASMNIQFSKEKQ